MKKNILIVGGTSGIGKNLVDSLDWNTWNIYSASRNGDSLAGSEITHIPLDVTQPLPALDALPETLHGFVYCPGSINLRPVKMLKEEAFRKDMELNFFGLVRVFKAIFPKLQEGSSLVFFSTIAVGTGMPFHSSIASAKGAIEGFARSLAAEFAPKFRVNVIAPSLVDTPLATRLLNNEQKREKMAERHPLKRTGKAEDISQMAAFLLSEQSSWITGQVLGVDGGLSTLNLQ